MFSETGTFGSECVTLTPLCCSVQRSLCVYGVAAQVAVLLCRCNDSFCVSLAFTLNCSLKIQNVLNCDILVVVVTDLLRIPNEFQQLTRDQ